MDSYKTYSDEQLVGLLKSSDEAAFEEIYNRYWKPLFRLAAARLKDFQLAEEIVQDVFFNFWKKREHIQLTAQLSYYLSCAAKYEIINARIRQEKIKSKELQFLEIDENLLSCMPLAQNELHDHFLKAIHHLPEKSQLVFKLSRHHGYSNKEIAGHLEISEKAVEYHVSKVIKLLRAGLTLALFCLVRTLVLLLNQQP